MSTHQSHIMEHDAIMSEEYQMLRFVKYGMIIALTVYITSIIIANGWMDAKTISEHAQTIMLVLILVLGMMGIGSIIQIAVEAIIEHRNRKKGVINDT